MNKIIITKDSGICPINEETMISGQIIDTNGKNYRDVLEIDNKKIIEDNMTYKTSSPLMSDYEETFRKYLEQNYDVIHLSMSSGISEGSNNAANVIANYLKQEYKNKIYIIDTLTGATGGTLINEIANNLVTKNLEAEDIVEILNKIKLRIKTSFYVPNPEGFLRSGRNKSEICKKEKALLLGLKTMVMTGIKFRVEFNEEGNLYTSGLLRGSNEKTFLKMVKNIVNEENIENFDPNYIVVGNLLKDKVNMEEIKNYLNELKYFDNIIEKDINGIVAAYGSHDLCGISLVKKKQL